MEEGFSQGGTGSLDFSRVLGEGRWLVGIFGTGSESEFGLAHFHIGDFYIGINEGMGEVGFGTDVDLGVSIGEGGARFIAVNIHTHLNEAIARVRGCTATPFPSSPFSPRRRLSMDNQHRLLR